MSLKEHLPIETLEQLLSGGLPAELRSKARLHLSYCPICRGLYDELALRFAAQRMWDSYVQSATRGETHITCADLRHFWLGRPGDEELAERVAAHCVVCLDCRNRRELARVALARDALSALTIGSLLLALATAVRKRPYAAACGGLAIVVAVVTLGTFWGRQGLVRPRGGGAALTAVQATPDGRTPPATPTPQTAGNSTGNVNRRRPGPRAPAEGEAPRDLVALAQSVDLKRAPEGADSRSAEAADGGGKLLFRIVASRSAPTRLRIGLPANSKRGEYFVSIRESAFLDEVVAAAGRSRDGVSLPVTLNLKDVKAGEYVLRITRRAAPAGAQEYIGEYHVLVVGRPPAAAVRDTEEVP